MSILTGSEPVRREALAYLLGNDVLWNTRLRPESVMLMARLWSVLGDEDASTLVDAVLLGPPPSGRDDEAARRDHHIGMRLMALEREGRPLPPRAMAALQGIREREPGFALSADGRELFPVWFSTGSGRRSEDAEGTVPSTGVTELKQWLRGASGRGEGRLDDWRALVAKKPGRGVTVLCSFAAEGLWPPLVWRDTLLGLEQAPRKTQAFRRLASLLAAAPDPFLREKEVGWAIGWWIPSVARSLPMSAEPSFWAVWDHLAPRVLAAVELDEERDPLSAALNQAPGRLAEALIWRWHARKPLVGGGMPPEVGIRFQFLAEGAGPACRIARVMLARSLSGLFANDPDWTRQHLLPRFSWADPAEAAAMWRGFLAGGPVDPNLFAALKPDFWDTLRNHATDVYESEDMVWQLLMVACLEMPGTISDDEARAALQQATTRGRREAAHYVHRLMPQDRPDRGAALWRERVGPWLSAAWPKDKGLRDAEVASSLTMAAALSGEAFPEALDAVAPFIKEGAGRSLLWHTILETKLPETFPGEVLRLMAATASFEQPQWDIYGLPELLGRMEEADPDLKADPRVRGMREGLARLGL